MKTKNNFTADRLREVFIYNSETGAFERRVNSRRNPNSSRPVGSVNAKGYLVANIDSTSYYLHRLAWLYVYGVMPSGVIDHINGCKSDNRISNLRDVGSVENCHNRAVSDLKKSALPVGVTVVSGRGLSKPFVARITVRGKSVNIGYFASPCEAHTAYLKEKALAGLVATTNNTGMVRCVRQREVARLFSRFSAVQAHQSF